MINEKVLLDNGYTEYVVPAIYQLNYVDRFFQKKIEDSKGIKYFIDFLVYHDEKSNKFDYECNLQFETRENYYMNIELFGLFDVSLEDIEVRVEKLWKSQDCRYYEQK